MASKRKTSLELTEIIQIRMHPGLRREAEIYAQSKSKSLGAYIRDLLSKDLDWSAPVRVESIDSSFTSFKDDGTDWFGASDKKGEKK